MAGFIFLGMFEVVYNCSMSSTSFADESMLELTCILFERVYEFVNHNSLQQFRKTIGHSQHPLVTNIAA